MQKLIIRDWPILLIVTMPFVVLVFTWNLFPAQVPIHFNLEGKPDDYANRTVGLLLLPGLNLFLYIILAFAPNVDPKRANYDLFADKFRIIRFVIHLFMTFTFFLMAAFTLGYEFNLTMVTMYGVVIILLIFGNYMGNIRMNYFIGIRTPWTLSNSVVWQKTHRFTGRLWVIACVCMLLCLPFIQKYLIVIPIFIAVIALVPIIYSYVIHKKLTNNKGS